MLKLKARLDHALRISYFDYVRLHEHIQKMSLSRRILTWIYMLCRTIAKYIIFLILYVKPRNKKLDLKQYEWIIVNDHSGHCELFMQGIVEKFSEKKSILYLSLNRKIKSTKYNTPLIFNEFRYLTIISLIGGIKYTWLQRNKFVGLGFWKFLILLNYIFDCSRVIEACNFYRKVKLMDNAKLITLCDSHWHQSVLTTEFNERKLQSFTLLHGQPSEWHLVYPFMSDYILTYGHSMSEMLLKRCPNVEEKQLIKIGNIKFPNFHEEVIDSSDYCYKDITEIVFISPGYNCFESYGFEGLGKELSGFLDLNIENISLAIRPYPSDEEKKFVENILLDRGLLDKVQVLNEPNFSKLVNNHRLFIGSISSAISDVFMFNGLFVGLCEEIPRDLSETMMTYSSDMYFSMNDIKDIIESFRYQKNIDAYLDKILIIRREMFSPVPEKLDVLLKEYAKDY